MTIEERLHHHQLDPVLPHTLTPPPDLADTVLRRVRRRRQRAPLLVVATAAAAAVAIATPVVVLRPDSGGSPAAPPTPTATDPSPGSAPTVLPALGGGPRTLHAFTTTSGRTSLLDVRTGHYRELPYQTVRVSPDLRRVAVVDERGRVGVADRDRLLREGGRAATWTALPLGTDPRWSPDGSALLVADLDKTAGTVRYTALRYDLRSRLVTSTPVPAGLRLIGAPMWAANSRDYLLLPVAEETTDTVRPGPLRTLHPDGTLGPDLAGPGGAPDGPAAFSPSRRLLVADTSQLMTDAPTPSPVLDARTGALVGTLPAGGGAVVGWYDERTVLRLTSSGDVPELVLVDARTGRTARTVRLPRGLELTGVQVGSSAGVSATAPRF